MAGRERDRVVQECPKEGEAWSWCRLCTCTLRAADDLYEGDNFELGVCADCKDRPEAKRLGIGGTVKETQTKTGGSRNRPARGFTPAEKSLISKVHGYMPPGQLLAILNERLACDLGPDASPYTIEQLHAEIGDASASAPEGGHDWASLRKLLARARRDGVLEQISEQVINDFAVVFSLNTRQVVNLKDMLLSEGESRAEGA